MKKTLIACIVAALTLVSAVPLIGPRRISRLFLEESQTRLEQRLASEPSRNNKQDSYALLVAGGSTGSDFRYVRDVLIAYGALLRLGFDKKDIYVLAYSDLAENGKKINEGIAQANKYSLETFYDHLLPFGKNSPKYSAIVDAPANKENIKRIFDYLSKKTDQLDRLINTIKKNY